MIFLKTVQKKKKKSESNNTMLLSVQSRPAVTTSTAVLPNVVASRTQSPVISSTGTHSADVAHGYVAVCSGIVCCFKHCI